MSEAEDRARERRWVVLAEDGRYSTLGRHSDPTDLELRVVEKDLEVRGIAAWLAIMEGNPYIGPLPRLMEVRAYGAPVKSFEQVAAACIARIAETRISSSY